MRIWGIALLLVLGFLSLYPGQARAHALDPGFLSIAHLSGDNWRVFWRKPTVGTAPMAIDARLPDICSPSSGPAPRFDGRAWITQWVSTCGQSFAGTTLTIEGLENTRTDVLIRLQDATGKTLSARVTADNPKFEVPAELSGFEVFGQYLLLGWEHILEGLDHLLFVFALLLLVQSPKRLVLAITAFTLAHSLTLAAATLGVVSVPSAPVEAAIALSIVLLAVEILKQGQGDADLTATYPWLVAFLFGLLHGLGFAGALSEIGLPESDIPLALLAFNIGVEAGQLTFVGAILTLFGAVRWSAPKLAHMLHAPGAAGTQVLGYAVGGIAVYWLAERVSGF